MNKTVAALSISTAFFAATTAYLAYERHQRDPDEAATAALVADAAPAPQRQNKSSGLRSS
jgi:hypothetical protein